jgi:hypothetical protein
MKPRCFLGSQAVERQNGVTRTFRRRMARNSYDLRPRLPQSKETLRKIPLELIWGWRLEIQYNPKEPERYYDYYDTYFFFDPVPLSIAAWIHSPLRQFGSRSGYHYRNS